MSLYEHQGFGGIGRHDPQAVYTKPPATPCLEVDYHQGPEWHRCNRCNESWLCWQPHAHGHPGCLGKPYVQQPPRRPEPDGRPREDAP